MVTPNATIPEIATALMIPENVRQESKLGISRKKIRKMVSSVTEGLEMGEFPNERTKLANMDCVFSVLLIGDCSF
jgi:hypothetical protein